MLLSLLMFCARRCRQKESSDLHKHPIVKMFFSPGGNRSRGQLTFLKNPDSTKYVELGIVPQDLLTIEIPKVPKLIM